MAAATAAATDDAAIRQLATQAGNLDLDTARNAHPHCYPDANLLDVYRAHLADVLATVSGVDPKRIYPVIQWTTGLDKGDFLVAVPALRVKGSKPDELAKEWASKFPENNALYQTPSVTNYFLSFRFRTAPLVSVVLATIRAQGSKFGQNQRLGLRDPNDASQGRKRIIVEFSSPNIAKPFHAGHLRSTILGGFLAHLYEGAGWDVIRINYLGDWGKQYGLLALAYERYGDDELLRQDPINHLFQLYVRINAEMSAEKEAIEAKRATGDEAAAAQMEAASLDEQARAYFRRMTQRDGPALAQWRRFRDLSIARYQETYARLNIHFDSYSGESQVSEEAMEQTAQAMAARGLTKEDQGAVIVPFNELIAGKEGKKLERPVVRKKDGTALYLTRDISELLGRHERYQFDKMIYVVASQQDLHLQQLFKIIELLGHQDIAAKCQHINFGLVLGMSTRKGTVKFLDDILRDVGDKMHEVMKKNEVKYAQVENPEQVADIMGISSVMVQDMTGKRINNYTFDMDLMTSFEGDTGPYLQYAHARLNSIKRKAGLTDADLAGADHSLLAEPHAVNLVRLLAQYPDVVQNTLRTLEPTTVLTYLFKLTHQISSSYDVLQVLGSAPALLRARLALYDAARVVLSNGMRLLGLRPLDRM